MPGDTGTSRIQPVGRNMSRLVFGIAIATAGVLFTLDNFDILSARSYLDYWPLFISAIGLAHLLQNRTFGGVVWGLILVFAGIWILGENLGFVDISIWTLSPLLLVLLGLSIIWRCCAPVPGVPRGSAVDGNRYIRGSAVLGAFERASQASDFRGADLISVMGGCELDLRQATIANGQAVVDVTAVMGGVELRVPETWSVDAQITPVMGGVTNRTRTVPGAAVQRLVVRGTVFMGGVEIKN